LKAHNGDPKKFDELLDRLEKITSLMVLIASKSGATSDEIGKVIDVSGSRVRNILAGVAHRKKR
jgi:DNA-directed RNA polymerase sigma subunit (sigma70/sigma32)